MHSSSTLGDVERGEQARGAVAHVVVGAPFGHAWHQRQHRLGQGQPRAPAAQGLEPRGNGRRRVAHLHLYREFIHIGGVTHTHSPHATMYAQASRELPCFGTTHADYFYGEVPVTRPMTQEEVRSAYEWETGNVIVERFKDINPAELSAVLVHGHGPFAWGPSGKKAVENAFALEIVAEMALKTLALGPHVGPIEKHLLDKHYLRKRGSDAYYGQSKPAENSNG